MKKRIFLPAFILTAASVLSLGFAGLAGAVDSPPPNSTASSVSISISPGQQRMSLNPGEAKTAEVTVINSGNVEYDVKVYATTYAISPDYTNNIFDGAKSSYSQIPQWISFDGQDSTSFLLKPSERKKVEFSVAVPENVPAGGQYAGIMAEVTPPSGASGVVAVRRVASLFYANINGNTISKGEVTERSWQGYHSSPEIKTSLTIKNSGNIDFAVENRLQITDLFGNSVDEVVEPSKMIFPETSRTFELTWHSDRPFGIFNVTQKSVFLDQTFSETKLIILLPIWFIVIALVIVVAIVVTIVFFVHRKKQGRRRAHRA